MGNDRKNIIFVMPVRTREKMKRQIDISVRKKDRKKRKETAGRTPVYEDKTIGKKNLHDKTEDPSSVMHNLERTSLVRTAVSGNPVPGIFIQ